MKKCFSTDIADKVGVNASIVYEEMLKYGDYITITELEEKIPIFTEKQIRFAINRLLDNGMIETSTVFRSNQLDRTIWYKKKEE